MDPAEARRLLGVGPDAGPDAVHLAYRTRARSAHPDVGGSWDEMAQINEAHRLLRQTVGPTEDLSDEPDEWGEWSDEARAGSVSALLRRSLVVLVGLCAVVVVVVFVAAVGYDWSVSTR